MRRSLPVVLGAALVGLGAAIPARPATPTVSGPRETTASRPVYTFRARGAVGFRCAFDGARLHRCAARYSERLAPGRHVLRVRSVGRSGALSRVVAVVVRVLEPVPALTVAPAIEVGAGVGVAAAAGDAVWVPATTEGALFRVAGGAVVGRTPVGPVPPGPGFLDSAVATDGAVWAASDAGARIVRVDPSSGAATTQLSVPDRPGGLAAGGGAVWAFHFLHGAVTRIDPATAAASRLAVGNARATGIAFGAGALWLLSTAPAQLLELDPATGAARRTIPLQPPFGPRRAFIDSWSLAFGEGALWAALPNHDAIARVDAVSGQTLYVQLRHGRPFGVATGGGSAWVATDRGVVRLDGATGAVAAASALPPADRSGFVSIAYGDGAAWLTNYDRGTLVRVTASP